jgi:glycosyltransferase A (GT-A) superfamily protein (DUF2064 family)
MARDVRPGHRGEGLESMLGSEGRARLESLMLERTVAWAEAVAPGRVRISSPGEDVAAAAAATADRFGGGPLIVVSAQVPRLGPGHAAAALLDLAEGADASYGPLHSGGWYLAALREVRSDLLPVFAAPDDGEPLISRTLGAAAELGLEVGLLRMERGLETPADARALLADPLLPADVRAVLVR